MKTLRMICLGGVAMLALSGAAFAAQPNTQEAAQTRQLNLQQSDAAIAPVFVTPARMTADAGMPQPSLAPMALNSFSNPPDKVATARVVDSRGITIGAVQKVDITGGKPTTVEISLLGTNQVISMDAKALSYDASNNVLTASQSDLAAAPRG